MAEKGGSPDEKLQQCEDAIADLYAARNNFVERYGVDKIPVRRSIINEQLQECLRVIDTIPADASTSLIPSAKVLALRGCALSVSEEPCDEARDFLSQAVKLDPSLIDAWNALGEYYWKKEDLSAAKNCFTCCLNQKKNKTSLRYLSMVLRKDSFSQDQDAKVSLIKESVAKSKEALSMDIKDGNSWMVLGNAYVALFFAESQSPAVLKQALGAYNQSEKDALGANSADLHHNRAVVYQFQQNYAAAWEGFQHALQLDPESDEFRKTTDCINEWLTAVNSLVENKGGVKTKRLRSMLQSLSDADLGNLSAPKSKGGPTLPVVSLSSLTEGQNEGVVLGRVVAVVTDIVVLPPVTCIVVDKDDQCIAVGLVNVSKQLPSVRQGAAIAIRCPIVQRIKVTCHGKAVDFTCLTLASIASLRINGQPLRVEEIALHTSDVSHKSE